MTNLQKYKDLERHCEDWLMDSKTKSGLKFHDILNIFIRLDEKNFTKMSIKLQLERGILFLWRQKISEAPAKPLKKEIMRFVLQEVRWEIYKLNRLFNA